MNFMVAASVVTTIMILNYHHRLADTHDMPAWVRTVFLQWIPWALRIPCILMGFYMPGIQAPVGCYLDAIWIPISSHSNPKPDPNRPR